MKWFGKRQNSPLCLVKRGFPFDELCEPFSRCWPWFVNSRPASSANVATSLRISRSFVTVVRVCCSLVVQGRSIRPMKGHSSSHSSLFFVRCRLLKEEWSSGIPRRKKTAAAFSPNKGQGPSLDQTLAMAFMMKKKRYKFQADLCLDELAEVSYSKAILFAKVRQLDGGAFTDVSKRYSNIPFITTF